MELKTTPGFHELIEYIGDNKELVFTLKVPGNFTWDMLHHVTAAMVAGAKEWQALVEKQLADAAQAHTDAEATEVTPEVVA